MGIVEEPCHGHGISKLRRQDETTHARLARVVSLSGFVPALLSFSSCVGIHSLTTRTAPAPQVPWDAASRERENGCHSATRPDPSRASSIQAELDSGDPYLYWAEQQHADPGGLDGGPFRGRCRGQREERRFPQGDRGRNWGCDEGDGRGGIIHFQLQQPQSGSGVEPSPFLISGG